MKRSRRVKSATLGAAALSTIVIPTSASEAQSEQTQVRFLHAVSGAGPAQLQVESGAARLPSRFAEPSGYQVFRPGRTRLRLILNGQSRPVATEVVRLGPGKHTVVAVGGENGVDLLVYEDEGVQPGKATLRAVHAASEVGSADVRVDGKVVVSDVGLGDATGYLAVPPGRHSVAVTRPGGGGGALVTARVRAVAGTASTAFVVGSAGMPAQVVLTEDGSAGPSAAPATGIGGAASGAGWLLIAGSSLIGGTLGGTSYMLARRSRSRRALQMAATPAIAAGPPPDSTVAAGPPVAEAPEPEAPVETEPVVAEPVVVDAVVVEPEPVVVDGEAVEIDAAEELVTPEPVAAEPVATPIPHPLDAAVNGKHENGASPPAPAVWTPPPGERWDGTPAPGPRFVRADAEVEIEPQPGRFVRADVPVVQPEEGVTVRAATSLPPLASEAELQAAEAAPSLPRWEGSSTLGADVMLSAPAPMVTEPPAYDAWTGAWIPDAPAEESELPGTPAAAEPAAVVEPAAIESDPVEPEPVEPATVEFEAVAPEPEPEPAPEPQPEPEPESAAEVAPVPQPAPMPQPAPPAPAVATWSTAPLRPGSATAQGKPSKVNFLVVSGAALIVTGLAVARRGGRH
jgi:hypothetical protein